MAKSAQSKVKRKRTQRLNGLLQDTRGLTTVEYIIVLCLIAVVGFAIWKKFGETVKTKVNAADSVMGSLPETSSAGGGGS